MAAFYDLLEEKWMECVRAGYAEIVMNFGLSSKHDATEASRKIYTPAVFAELEMLLNEAHRATTEASLFRRRVEWVKGEYLNPLKSR